MEYGARLNSDINLISDLFENLSDSSFETEDSDSDGGSSSGSGSASEGDNSNSPTESRDERREDSDNDSREDSEYDSSSSGSDDDSSDGYEDEEDDIDLNFELDKFDLRLTRLIKKAFDKFNEDFEAEIEALPLDELQTENRSELESCLISFYSKLRDQASSCVHTFYGPKSYEFNRLLRLAISVEERRALNSFKRLWTQCCHKRDFVQRPPPVFKPSRPPRQPQQPPKLQEQEAVGPGSGPKNAQKINKDIGAGDSKRLWNHITISRDQTRASDFTKELLNIFRISSRNQAPDHSNTSHHPHPRPDGLFHSNPIRRGSPTGRLSPSQLERKGAVPTPPDAYSEPALVSVPSANNVEFDENVMSHTEFTIKMRESPQIKTSAELSKPEVSGSNSECGTPGPVSEAQPPVDGSLDHLMGRIASLETENRDLKEAKRSLARPETIYFIRNEHRGPVPYVAAQDEPSWSVGPAGEIVLKSNFAIHDVNGYLRQKTDIAFVINKYYDVDHQDQEVRASIRDKRPLPRAECSHEAVRLHSFEMVQAAEEFISKQPKFAEEFPGLDISNGVGAPYLFWYYYRSKNALEGLSPTSLAAMKLLTSWIEENYGELYDLVEDQLKRGVTSAKTIKFLVKPGDNVVWKEKRDLMAAVTESWPLVKRIPQAWQGSSLVSRRDEWGTKNKEDEAIPLWKSSVKCWQYGFDGSFYRRERELEISFRAENQEEEVPIEKLSAYPLQYAPDVWKETLDARGRMSWSCRHQRIASYEDDRGLYGNSERFMIDFHTYEQLHSDSNSFKKSYPTIDDPNVKRMDSEVMESDDPPPIPDLYVFPNTIPAYNLRSKKWVDLEVDKIRDVTWNKKSFEHLVVDIETKDLIQALITNQIARGQGTDTIDGKGNGLIILLHGGPGTGKTFTAESVAEMAEKPLFRVTCGDIGTKPEEVEKYLESVLHLGKNWGCVVLLDEADVFLEQRTLTDLERNALVSVFLRVLEYYEGILILTSNRVGTFDEAFKSRIQLSLHYENLTEGQRGRIWKNFLTRLKDLERQSATGAVNGDSLLTDKGSNSMGIDFDDVECYLSDLARVELNGRQIRNAITTARQLAKFKGELMAYHHLRHVIKVSSKFDSYLKNVQEGYSDDQIARGGGIR